MVTVYFRCPKSLAEAIRAYVRHRPGLDADEAMRYILALYLDHPDPQVMSRHWNERMTEKLSIHIPEATQTALNAFAASNGLTASDVIRQAVYQIAVLHEAQIF